MSRLNFLILPLYNLLLPFALLVLLPGSIVKMRRRGGYGGRFWQRFGFFDRETKARLAAIRGRCLWIHAVSVGEVNIARRLIDELLRREPERPLALSVTTTTGFAVATQNAPENLLVIYSPLDLPPVVRAVFRRLRPLQLILVEAEVWPNLVRHARRLNVPVSLVNARLSPRSERRYRRFRWLAAPVFGMLDQVLAQEPEDVPRWTGIGVNPERVTVTGSVKFDPAGAPGPSPERAAAFRRLLEQHFGAPLPPFVLAASTHAGEEKALAERWKTARAAVPQARLLIAPRHAERRAEVLADVESAGLSAALRSAVPPETPGDPDALILDSTGELRDWQALAAVVVIGKSFLAHGGQNPVEAITAGVPVITGPHMENFAALVNLLERAEGVRRLADLSELAPALIEWLRNPEKAAAFALRGRDALMRHHGATARATGELEKMRKNSKKNLQSSDSHAL